MSFQLLISTMDNSPNELLQKMNVRSDAIVINQCDFFARRDFAYQNAKITWLDFNERGVGLSRNSALMRASSDIVLFCDDDCRYVDDLEPLVLRQFEMNPKADLILFNVDLRNVPSYRGGTKITRTKRVSKVSYMRYGIVHCAARLSSLRKANVSFSLLFGGGALYSCGEDTIFYHDCLREGLKIVTCSETIGSVDLSQSSWFEGYTEKFFRDRGALHWRVSSCLHPVVSLRFSIRNKSKFSDTMNVMRAWLLMIEGANEFRLSEVIR